MFSNKLFSTLSRTESCVYAYACCKCVCMSPTWVLPNMATQIASSLQIVRVFCPWRNPQIVWVTVCFLSIVSGHVRPSELDPLRRGGRVSDSRRVSGVGSRRSHQLGAVPKLLSRCLYPLSELLSRCLYSLSFLLLGWISSREMSCGSIWHLQGTLQWLDCQFSPSPGMVLVWTECPVCLSVHVSVIQCRLVRCPTHRHDVFHLRRF